MSKEKYPRSGPLNVQQALDAAVRHHSAGRLPDAEDIYRQILDSEPENPFALHLLGVIAHQSGDDRSARELIESAIVVKPDYAQAHCNLGLVHKALGRLEDAVASYRQAVAIEPGDAQAHNNLGNALLTMERLDAAAESYRRALAAKPDYANAHSNLGLALHRLGHLDDAIASCRRALELEPNHAGALSNLGLALQENGQSDLAAASFRHALSINSDDAELHNNLGNALQELERPEDAVESYRRAVALAPEYFDAHNNLGNALHELERYDDAMASYRRALALDPENADAHNNLGLVLNDRERFDDAVDSYRRALSIDPEHANAYSNLGLALTALEQPVEAITNFDKFLALTRDAETATRGGDKFGRISKAKIDHDIEQFRYLEALGCDAARFAALAADYDTLREEIDWPRGDGFLVSLSDAQRGRIADSYNRPINRVAAPELPGSTLGESIDAAEITRQYYENAPGMTYFDGVLSTPALVALRRFLLESTIWFDFRYRHGYLGAFLNDGLGCPLVLQIAEDFRRTFPDIFKDHRLRQCWAYKYDSNLTGIDVHADTAAVNVNFWITPDSANLNRNGGGLVVYKVEAPLDWRFNSFNNDQKNIRRFLAENDRGKLVVPHAENRAVLFNSDLFHETDTIEFKPGYENRRINVTMLFGNRTPSVP